MARIKNPVRFSNSLRRFRGGVDASGALNPTLNAHTKLFIDPFLIPDTGNQRSRKEAIRHIDSILRGSLNFLRLPRAEGDVPWRNARRLMEFPEIKGTCLGYGAQSVSGSGSRAFTTAGVMQTAKAIVDLGIDDPDLFVAMGLFEEGIGPDRISDMATNVILPDLLKFNTRILARVRNPDKEDHTRLSKMGLATRQRFQSTHLNTIPRPQLSSSLRIFYAISRSQATGPMLLTQLRKTRRCGTEVNKQIAEIWQRRTLKDKDTLRRWAMSNRDTFGLYLQLLRGAKPKPYDIEDDPLGELVWRRVAETIAEEQPFRLSNPQTPTVDGVAAIVKQIIEQFQFLIEKRRLSEDLYHGGNPRPEKAAQRLFFAVAHASCKANNLDLTPEADTGNGPVDFKMSSGFKGRVLVEIKLSTNSKVVAGFSKQLETYREAEETTRGFYVVIGAMGRKPEQLIATKNLITKSGRRTSEIVFVNGIRRPSASKL